MVVIEDAIRLGQLPNIPVYVDGMVWDITAIHTTYPEFMNSSVRKLVFHRDHNPFLAECFRRVGSQKERMQIIENAEPCLILATSGMLTGGPSVEYLRQLADELPFYTEANTSPTQKDEHRFIEGLRIIYG